MEWISVEKELPKILADIDRSENVLAVLDGTNLCVMCYTWVDGEDDNSSGYVWANCYGDIKGDAEFDDDYNVTHWMYLPKPPKN